MKRHVIQFIFAIFFGFSATTGFLVAQAADQVSTNIISDTNTSATSDNQPAEPVKADSIASDYQGSNQQKAATRSSGNTNIRVTVTRGSYISIGGRDISIFDTGTTAVDAGSRVARYGDRFLFGHNSGSVFGHLAGLPIGTEFSVTLNGNTTNYRISNKVIFNHEFTPSGQELLYPEGYPGRNFMSSIINARYMSRQYSLSLMTCHGISYGGGDASQRLVVFADAI